jgi:hypothetical protein
MLCATDKIEAAHMIEAAMQPILDATRRGAWCCCEELSHDYFSQQASAMHPEQQ